MGGGSSSVVTFLPPDYCALFPCLLSSGLVVQSVTLVLRFGFAFLVPRVSQASCRCPVARQKCAPCTDRRQRAKAASGRAAFSCCGAVIIKHLGRNAGAAARRVGRCDKSDKDTPPPTVESRTAEGVGLVIPAPATRPELSHSVEGRRHRHTVLGASR